MRYELAPLEGITTYVYRQCLKRHFGEGMERCYTPFVTPHVKRTMTEGEKRELDPIRNAGLPLVPQVLANNAPDVMRFALEAWQRGYLEININLGCPSGTVVPKRKGAGMLADPEGVDTFLQDVFCGSIGEELNRLGMAVSVKTRIGMWDPAEWPELLAIYNRYPIKELIIHARVREEFYNGLPHRDAFTYALDNCSLPLCYNGDLWTAEQVREMENSLDSERCSLMMGRGVIANPALFREAAGGAPLSIRELEDFLEDLAESYRPELNGDNPVVYRLKEIWSYLIRHMDGRDKQYKALLKSRSLSDCRMAQRALLRTYGKDAVLIGNTWNA